MNPLRLGLAWACLAAIAAAEEVTFSERAWQTGDVFIVKRSAGLYRYNDSEPTKPQLVDKNVQSRALRVEVTQVSEGAISAATVRLVGYAIESARGTQSTKLVGSTYEVTVKEGAVAVTAAGGAALPAEQQGIVQVIAPLFTPDPAQRLFAGKAVEVGSKPLEASQPDAKALASFQQMLAGDVRYRLQTINLQLYAPGDAKQGANFTLHGTLDSFMPDHHPEPLRYTGLLNVAPHGGRTLKLILNSYFTREAAGAKERVAFKFTHEVLYLDQSAALTFGSGPPPATAHAIRYTARQSAERRKDGGEPERSPEVVNQIRINAEPAPNAVKLTVTEFSIGGRPSPNAAPILNKAFQGGVQGGRLAVLDEAGAAAPPQVAALLMPYVQDLAPGAGGVHQFLLRGRTLVRGEPLFLNAHVTPGRSPADVRPQVMTALLHGTGVKLPPKVTLTYVLQETRGEGDAQVAVFKVEGKSLKGTLNADNEQIYLSGTVHCRVRDGFCLTQDLRVGVTQRHAASKTETSIQIDLDRVFKPKP